MQLTDARLCLDCQEIHDQNRCPVCTSEAFAFITRWVKVEDAQPLKSSRERRSPDTSAKAETYRQMLQPGSNRSKTGKWLRNGSLLVAAGFLARWGWQAANRQAAPNNTPPKDSN